MTIRKIIVIQQHTNYISLKRERVKQALLLMRSVIHYLRENMLQNMTPPWKPHQHYSRFVKFCEILVKTETASILWAKRCSQYPQKQFILLSCMSKLCRNVMHIIVPVVHPLTQGKLLSSARRNWFLCPKKYNYTAVIKIGIIHYI